MGRRDSVDPRVLETAPPAWVTPLVPGSLHETPDGVEVRRSGEGLGLFATARFAPGDVIFSRTPCVIPDDGTSVPVRIRVDGVITDVVIEGSLSVRLGSYRHVSMPDYVFNHACDPNTYTRVCADGISFDQIAVREIAPGDELTCDYVVFDWDGDGHVFVCTCGAPGCYGEVRGFGGLPPDTQERLAHLVHPWVRLQWERSRQGVRT